MVSNTHKVFISYYHDEDQNYAYRLADKFYGIIIDKSMYEDLRHLTNESILRRINKDHLADSTVTVVLVGKHTYGRKWVDWEIHASLRPYAWRTRNGLVGLFLPKHANIDFRLTDNIYSGYAVPLNWRDVDEEFEVAVHKAWNRRKRDDLIDNGRSLRLRNASL